jgi:GH25 family lysozyme M1 (1,4-beta-N-acetylmuramidase)
MAVQIKGIDVSKWQADKSGNTKVDFSLLKRSGYEFVILRASIGRSKDISFESHYKAAKAAGLHIGAYHYLNAKTRDEALAEADFFLKTINGRQLDYPICLDIESDVQKKLGMAKCTDIALAFMQKVEAAGYYTMLYSGANFISKYLDMERLRHFDVWLACYTSEERREELYKHDILGIWQYSSSVILPGVYPGRLDHNIAYKDYAKIISRAGLNNLN